MLEETIAGDKRSHILKVHIEGNNHNFTAIGTLSFNGISQYWRAIDSKMREFDIGKTELQPIQGNKLSVYMGAVERDHKEQRQNARAHDQYKNPNMEQRHRSQQHHKPCYNKFKWVNKNRF